MLSDDCIRASWEAERESLFTYLVEKKFNPKHIPRVISNFISSMVYAKLPCTSEAGVKAAYHCFVVEKDG